MNRLRAVLAMISAATLLTLGLQATPAYAFPTSTFYSHTFASHGVAEGGFIWYNRSVNVKGSLTDDNSNPNGSTTVEFRFYAGNTLVKQEFRSIGYRQTRPYNFTVPGPVGGITVVDIHVCPNDDSFDQCGSWDPYFRP
jgi:hypothetical protein